MNADIDKEYQVVFKITNIHKLDLDIKLSGGIEQIPGYKIDKALDSHENLLALLEHDRAGIDINNKAVYFK